MDIIVFAKDFLCPFVTLQHNSLIQKDQNVFEINIIIRFPT